MRLRTVLAFGVGSAAVAGLLGTSWLDLGVAFVLGLLIGWIAILSATRPNLAAANEAVSALVATTLRDRLRLLRRPDLTSDGDRRLADRVDAGAHADHGDDRTRDAAALLGDGPIGWGVDRVAQAHLRERGGLAGHARDRLGRPVPPPSQLPPGIESLAALCAAASFAVLFRTATRDVRW